MRQADNDDTKEVSNILSEAALWLIDCNMPLWKLIDV
jgi:hypothetical protein